MTKQQENLGPCHSLLVYVYILLFSLIFSMHIDVTKKCMTTLDTAESIYSSLIRESQSHEEISLPDLRQLLNWAVITILFLIKKIPSKNICIYNSIKIISNLNIMNFINFWYQMIFRNGKTCLYYIGKQENFRKTRKFKFYHLNKHKINNNSSKTSDSTSQESL